MKRGKTQKPKGKPKFDHKTGGVSRLPDLLTDWFGAHKAGVVAPRADDRFAADRKVAAKGR